MWPFDKREGSPRYLSQSELDITEGLMVEAPEPTLEQEVRLYELYRSLGGQALPSHERSLYERLAADLLTPATT
jgi:hypothetical protein